MKLKQLLIDNFVPSDEVTRIESRATWDEESDNWLLPRLELAGNQIRPKRPMANPSSIRPESEYGRNRKKYDNNPRYKADNIVDMELEMADRYIQFNENNTSNCWLIKYKS